MNVFELIKEKLEEETYCPNCSMYCADADMCGFDEMRKQAISIVDEVAQEYNNGWIPCSEELPPQPKENVLFDYKPLELYMVTEVGVYYPFRAFWNGKTFTDGIREVEVTAWRPLPAPYKEGGSDNE